MTALDPLELRPARADDSPAVLAVVAAAFVDEPEAVGLQESLAQRDDHVGYVAVHEGRIVGHVGLTRGWIDAEPRLVEVLVLSPLSVAPEVHRRGVGRALVERAVAHARDAGAPVLLLEGDPAYYSRLGWRPASELGITPPSPRIPAPALQCVRLSAHEDWMRGPLVYADTFWAHDAVGLRGERLAAVLAALEG